MHRVYDRIRQRRREFEQLPVLRFLRDDRVPVRERLGLAPGMAHFVMSFADLNRFVFAAEDHGDPHQALVNAHAREDEDHWRWFLHDLAQLGHDEPVGVVDVLRGLWSEETVATRRLTYRICGLAHGAEPLLKLAVIEVLEVTGNVFFGCVAPLGAEARRREGLDLRFFGPTHLGEELGHVANERHLSEELATVPLDDARAERFVRAVDEAFDAVAAFLDEALANAVARRRSDRPRAVAAGRG